MLQSFYSRGHLLKTFNESNNYLIPKGTIQEMFSDFRLISLCNVVYKFITKFLAIRIKPILDEIIFPSQYAFIQGRYIMDNIIIAYEICQFMRKTKSKIILGVVKIDFQKAYDGLRWEFIEKVLHEMNFPDH